MVKPKKLKKLIKLKPKLKKAKKLKKKLGKKLLPFAIPFGAGVGLGSAGGFGASQLAPLLAGLGGGGGAALPFLAPPAMLATLAVQQQGWNGITTMGSVACLNLTLKMMSDQ